MSAVSSDAAPNEIPPGYEPLAVDTLGSRLGHSRSCANVSARTRTRGGPPRSVTAT